jgi:hypothetical protein
MRRVVWDIDGTRYELLINRLPDSGRANVSTPEPDIPVLRQKKIRRVVVIMHGIRDEGEWMPPLERLIRDETGAEAQSLNIDRISLTRFLLAERFLGYVKSYSDSALQLLSNYNEADVFFIAHSYGTWCLRDLLNNWPYKGNIMPTGIIVCGSILPMNCPWGKIHSSIFKRPRQDAELPWVWNDIGGRDPFPLLARVVSEGYGDSGVNRFTDATPKLIVNRVHCRLDHGGFFITHENGHNVLNKEFVRAYWLPIIRGEDAPREGVEPRISPFIKRLSYWVKTARELVLWITILEIAGWSLVRLGTGWLVVLGWCLAIAGGASLIIWICMGLKGASSTMPKPGRSAVILLFILPLLIVGIAGLVATMFNKTKPDTITPTPTPFVTPAPVPPNDLVEHLNRVWRTLWGENANNMLLKDSEDLESIKRRAEEIETIMYGKDAAEKLQDTALRDQITKKILPDLFGN